MEFSTDVCAAALPKPKETEKEKGKETDIPLPQTLVRIPTQTLGLTPDGASGGVAD